MMKISILAMVIFLAAAVFIAIFVNLSDNETCYYEETRIVRGESLSGLLEDGDKVTIMFGYYGCNEVKRDEIVAYNLSGRANPIIKIVKALPGDRFAIKENSSFWDILVNGEPLKNSMGKNYKISQNAAKLLMQYEKDYNGTLPDRTYLILGNDEFGSLDSTHLGFVHRDDILGKAVR